MTEHVPCAACGYDLFGLAVEGACPECGFPPESREGATQSALNQYRRAASTRSLPRDCSGTAPPEILHELWRNSAL